MDSQRLSSLADAFAFLGNSLLAPMTQTSPAGLDSSFWDAFPDFDNDAVRAAAGGCRAFAAEAQRAFEAGEDAVQAVAVEYTKLFIGPPRPLAAPWETMHRSDSAVGFGQAAFGMKQALRDVGLEVKNENNQYPDHMGIELLLLSELCRRAANAEGEERVQAESKAVSFAQEHPASWVESLESAVSSAYPSGYFAPLLALAKTLLDALIA